MILKEYKFFLSSILILMKTLSFQHGYLEYQQRKTKAAKKQQNKLKTALFAVAYIIDG